MKLETLKQIQGLQTVNTVSDSLDTTKNYAYKLLSQLERQGYVTKKGGGKNIALYKISTKKQVDQDVKGMYDLINKYSKIKLAPLFIHKAYFDYTIENALIDALLMKKIRHILAATYLFKNIKN